MIVPGSSDWNVLEEMIERLGIDDVQDACERIADDVADDDLDDDDLDDDFEDDDES